MFGRWPGTINAAGILGLLAVIGKVFGVALAEWRLRTIIDRVTSTTLPRCSRRTSDAIYGREEQS